MNKPTPAINPDIHQTKSPSISACAQPTYAKNGRPWPKRLFFEDKKKPKIWDNGSPDPGKEKHERIVLIRIALCAETVYLRGYM